MSFRVHSRLRGVVFALSAASAILLLVGALGARALQTNSLSDRNKESYLKAMRGADLKISAAEQGQPEVMQNEEYLTTYVGPRLTGSAGLEKAAQWALNLFRKYGLDAHLETSQIAHAWYRGNDWGKLVTPVEHWMTVRSAAWSKATPGP